MSQTLFMQPLDVLFLRGNKLFGEPGSFGEALVPPWPSVAAGALRTRMLADAGIDWSAARRKEPVQAHPSIGTPDQPGSFAVRAFQLALRHNSGRVTPLFVPPADLVITQEKDQPPQVNRLSPIAPETLSQLTSSYPLPMLPVLAENERRKPAAGYWLNPAGWQAWLAGDTPQAGQLVPSGHLWALESRVGVGLDADTRRASDGRLFTVQAVAMTRQGRRLPGDGKTGEPEVADYNVGFLAEIAGAEPPVTGAVRLGGDGRAAMLSPAGVDKPEPGYAAIAAARRCRLVLTTPGIFEHGWLPTGAFRDGDDYRFELHGVRGKLAGAAVQRAEVVSGWDLAQWKPKPAQRAAATGSVYWLDELEADEATLRTFVEAGLWGEPCPDAFRRAEGFNRCAIGAWERRS